MNVYRSNCKKEKSLKKKDNKRGNFFTKEKLQEKKKRLKIILQNAFFVYENQGCSRVEFTAD